MADLIEDDEEPVCLDHDPFTCKGAVEYRMALSPTGKSYPRCAFHWAKRLDEEERIRDRYPDSSLPPADFDPTYAGERWDDDY